MIWNSVSDIRTLQVEITSLCQAGCLDCNRWRPENGYQEWLDNPKNTVWKLNSHHHYFNKFYPEQEFSEHIKQFDNLDHVQFCGNVGDPMAHPNISDCVRHILNHIPSCAVDLSTNGAIGNLAQYEQIANLSKKFDVSITFAIDGLEDTNNIYRRGVEWKRLMDRVQHFISLGGRADWMWVDFPHTRHQIDQAEQLSKKLGFEQFEIRSRLSPETYFDQEIIVQSNQPIMRNEYHVEKDLSQSQFENMYSADVVKRSTTNIDAGCKKLTKQNKFYHPCPHLNVDGTLWPCCYTAVGLYSNTNHIRYWWQNLAKKYGEGWNSLYHYSLKEIVANSFYQNDLETSWHTQNPLEKNLICMQHCGQCVNIE